MSKKPVIVLDAGHGGKDGGASKYLLEKKVNLSIAKYCRDYLKKKGYTVKMTRTTDICVGNASTIARKINRFKPTLAVSIHANAGGGDGAEVYYSIVGGTGKVLATNILKELEKVGQNSRGIKTRKNERGTDYYGVIRETVCPAVIVEVGFVDNKKDAAQFDTLAEQKVFAEAIAKGIIKTIK